MRRIRLISAGMAQLMQSPQVERYILDALGPVESEARSSAPRETGAYAASIHRTSGVSGDRAFGRVVADAPHALAVESRTGNLSRALNAAREPS